MTSTAPFDIDALRAEFPILSRQVDGHPLVYLDNAATTQKPQCVIDALVDYYQSCNANVHRGAHQLADEATRRFEAARETVAQFLHAAQAREIIWTRGTTESLNIVANGMAQRLQAGDEVVVTEMEHHANLVPWQQACKRSGAILRIAPINERGELCLERFAALLGERTRLVAFPHVSNALGTINPVQQLCRMARDAGALSVVDGAQGVAHGTVDVQALGCDFYAFSAHKLFGPTGIGVLWGREALLEEWPVWCTGGEMIAEVSYQDARWNELPYRFEAGTPNIAGAIGTAAAINWFAALDMNAVRAHEASLLSYASEQVSAVEGLKIIGTAADKIAVISFVMDAGHPGDIGFLLDRQGVAIRTGHHCAEPLMARLGVPGTARASFSIYNTPGEVDRLVAALHKVRDMLA